jgi:hypothetical protein
VRLLSKELLGEKHVPEPFGPYGCFGCRYYCNVRAAAKDLVSFPRLWHRKPRNPHEYNEIAHEKLARAVSILEEFIPFLRKSNIV